MKQYAVIVAGGQGIRMKGVLPKQFLPLAGKPILFHTLERFQIPELECILVMNPEYIPFWEELCAKHTFTVPHRVVAGGTSRAASVWNGIKDLENNSFVAIHDAVRPVVSRGLIEKLFTTASEFGNAIPVIAVKDTLREIIQEGSKTVNRDNYRSVQTPQVFKTDALKKAFSLPDFEKYTDEASLFQAAGNEIWLVDGEETNIKITVPSDIILVEAFLRVE